jgi:hypothetical protein
MRILALARGACVAITIAVCLPALAAPAGLGLGAHGGYGQSVDAESGSLIAGRVAGAGAVVSPGDDYEVFGEVLCELNDPERDLGDSAPPRGAAHARRRQIQRDILPHPC